MNTRSINNLLNKSDTSTNSESKNRTDGTNTSRGEGLPYREDTTQSEFTPKPFISQVLAARHPEGANKTNGHNTDRGEGLPYQETLTTDNNIELSAPTYGYGKNH